MALAAGLPTIFEDREDMWLEGLQLLVHDGDEVGTEQCSRRGSNKE